MGVLERGVMPKRGGSRGVERAEEGEEGKGFCVLVPAVCLLWPRESSVSGIHWGQGVVYRAGTSQVHCKEMDKEPTPVYRKYIQNFPANFIAVFQCRKCPVHSQCSRSCDCNVLIR